MTLCTSYSDILIPHGFFVEFASTKPLNYFSIGASGDLATRKLTMFGDTICHRISLLIPYGFFVKFCSYYHSIGKCIRFRKIERLVKPFAKYVLFTADECTIEFILVVEKFYILWVLCRMYCNKIAKQLLAFVCMESNASSQDYHLFSSLKNYVSPIFAIKYFPSVGWTHNNLFHKSVTMINSDVVLFWKCLKLFKSD